MSGTGGTGDYSKLAALLNALFGAIDRRDWDAVFALVADGCMLAPVDDNTTYHGRNAISAYFKRSLGPWPDFILERVEELVAPTGESAVVGVDLLAVAPEAELREHVHLYYVVELRDGKLWRLKGYPSYLDARAAAGLMEEPRWLERKLDKLITHARERASDTLYWYRVWEPIFVPGVAALLTLGWVTFFTGPTIVGTDWASNAIGAVWLAGAILALIAAVVLRASTWRLCCWLVFLVLFFVQAFAQTYYSIGTCKDFAGIDGSQATAPCVTGKGSTRGMRPRSEKIKSPALSPLDATYFAVGTLSTAGTGPLNATSQRARGAQLVEMILGMALLLIVVSAVVARLAQGRTLRHSYRREPHPWIKNE